MNENNSTTHIMTNAQFAGKIKSIKTSTHSMREAVQDALVAATYLCFKNSGGTSSFQQILDAVGGTAHRQGITQWVETYAPVMLKNDKLLLNKTAWRAHDVASIVETFDDYVKETGMYDIKWYAIAIKKNTTVSVFDLDATLSNFLKKLEKNELPELAEVLRKAEQDYMAKAIKSEMANLTIPLAELDGMEAYMPLAA